MGVWSSISFCHLERKSRKTSFNTRTSNPKQILSVDSDSFSTTLLRDVKEFRIQESISEALTGISLQETQKWPTNFEYSMGGNLKFYKKHLNHYQDHLESGLPTVSYLGRQRNISTSDNDSEPESLRYSRKSLLPSTVDMITEEREPELSFDNYSSIYQPEFLLNIRSQSLVGQVPNEIREARQCEEIADTRKPKENRTSDISVEKQVEERKPKANKTDNISVKKPGGQGKPTLKSKRPAAANIIKEQEVFDYDDYTCSNVEENTTQNKCLLRQDDRQHRNELFIKEEELKTKGKPKIKTEKNEVIKKGKEKKSRTNTSSLATTDVVSTENMALDFSLCFNKHGNVVRDNTNWFEEINVRNKSNSVGETRKQETEFYPESPTAEVDFIKTPCSTRHNSLESLTDLENCIEETSEKEHCKKIKDHPAATSVQLLQENYSKLPKEFQEMARRLFKKDELKKCRPSLHQITSLQHFNCSSSTCSTNSPRSPSGKILSRTPSYKMPKTPSLSRQHPATYVTQHTSSRSRPSSRVSSRATSPTHENCEDSSIKDFIDSWKREARIQDNLVSKYKDTSPSKRTQKFM